MTRKEVRQSRRKRAQAAKRKTQNNAANVINQHQEDIAKTLPGLPVPNTNPPPPRERLEATAMIEQKAYVAFICGHCQVSISRPADPNVIVSLQRGIHINCPHCDGPLAAKFPEKRLIITPHEHNREVIQAQRAARGEP